MKRGDLVTHEVPALDGRVEAIIRRAHRDGSFTVEQRFFLKTDGDRMSGYLGYKLRLDAGDLRPAA